MHLSSVRTDDPHIYTFMEYAVAANLLEVLPEDAHREFCLAWVHPAEAVLLFAEVLLVAREGFLRHGSQCGGLSRGCARLLLAGVYPFHGSVPVQDAPVAHGGVALQLSLVELLVGKLHDGITHSILYAQERHAARLVLHEVLHKCLVQSPGQRLRAFQGGGQLAVVTRQDEAVGLGDGYPAGCFECLCSLVDEERAEAAS